MVTAADRAAATFEEEGTSRTPTAFREGARGRGFSQRSRLPRIPRSLVQAGRGGSVSRRDLDQVKRRECQLAGAGSSEKGTSRIPAALREGAGEGLLSEKPPPPELSPLVIFGRGPGEGLLSEKPPPPEFSPLVIFGREREGGSFWNRSLLPRKKGAAYDRFG